MRLQYNLKIYLKKETFTKASLHSHLFGTPFKTPTQFLIGFILEKNNWLHVPVCKEKLWMQLYYSILKDKSLNSTALV